ncbi:MAG: SLC13/DASS family transporter [Calditrichaeota bacterium]|nr:MAG: SLC13/DASS family transporter [Calditrichota bacterium]
MANSQKIKLLISLLIPLLILIIPKEFIPINDITIIEQRLTAIFFMAALLWILEPIPIYATSLLIILLELILVSDKGLNFLISDTTNPEFGQLLNYKSIVGTFASPIIMLFLGGFFLAMSATKYRLDLNLAKNLLKPFGKKPKFILLGLMVITSLFSMFMSNTATTAMMLAVLTPVLASFPKNDKGKIAFVLAIPFAANIGGIGTPIGTPPNVVALKYLTGENQIGFGEWMVFSVPFLAVLLVFTWLVLWKLFPSEQEKIEIKIKGKFLRNAKAITVYFTFGMTIFLWLFDFLHGMNSYIVALIPVAVFSATKIITKEDLKNVSWDVLWLVSGGIALGQGLEESGLAKHLVETVPFGTFSSYVIILSATLLTILMASLMSNTATANLLLPIVAALGVSLPELEFLGGAKMLILAVTFSCSLAMPLPVSTPPNAMAHATGLVESNQMAKVGSIIGIFGLLASYLLMFVLNEIGFF